MTSIMSPCRIGDENGDLDVKVKAAFIQLRNLYSAPLKDDTIIHKFKDLISKHLESREHRLKWCDDVGLLSFIQDSLTKLSENSECEIDSAKLALHLFSFIVKREEEFEQLLDHEIVVSFKSSFAILQISSALLCGGISIVESLLQHKSGYNWLTQNRVWEDFLRPSLECKNIFVRRDIVNTICTLMMNNKESEIHNRIFSELHDIVLATSEPKLTSPGFQNGLLQLPPSTGIVIQIFNKYLIETLGKISLDSKHLKLMQSGTNIVNKLNFESFFKSSLDVCKMITLCIMHKFSDKLITTGNFEQIHFNSLVSDVFNFVKFLAGKEQDKTLRIALFNLNQYWNLAAKNISEKNLKICFEKHNFLSLIILRIQVIPLLCTFVPSMMKAKSECDRLSKWDGQFREKLVMESKVENELYNDVESQLVSQWKSKKESIEQRDLIDCLLNSMDYINDLQPVCASSMFECISFFLSSWSAENERVLQQAIDVQRLLVERFSNHLSCTEETFDYLCHVLDRRSPTSKLKVSVLDSMRIMLSHFDISKFINSFQVQSMSDPISSNQFAHILSQSLSDLEWEVRDSALVLLAVIARMASNDCNFIIDWMKRTKLIDAVLLAMGDVEAYVQASSFQVLAVCASNKELWNTLPSEQLKRRALVCILISGDVISRQSALEFTMSVYANNKFTSEEIETLLRPILQKATDDIDDQVRLKSLQFIRKIFENDLEKINTDLNNSNKREKLRSAFNNFNKSGYLKCASNRIEDPVHSVYQNSIYFLIFIKNIVEKDNLEVQFEDTSTSTKSIPGSEKLSSDNRSVGERESVDEKYQRVNCDGNEENDCDMEYVVNSNDLSEVSRLQKKPYESSLLRWWDESSFSEKFTDLIPEPLTPLCNTEISQLFIVVCEEKKKLEGPPDTIDNFIQILDDIFLETSEQIGKTEMDCY